MTALENHGQLEGCVVSERFRLLRRLGGTSASSVYLTEIQADPPRRAALKLIAASEPDAEARLAGWSAATRLSHPNLIGVIDCGHCQIDQDQFVYQVTEYADEILAEILKERPLTPEETREMLGPVFAALTYMHAQGYAHAHVKPSNVLAVDDRLKLSADSITLGVGPTLSRAGTSIYEAPELARGPITPAADVWALGMTLVAALTQKPTRWESSSGREPMVPADIAEPFGEIAKRCLQVDPAERCTLDELRAILDPALKHPATEDLAIEHRSVAAVAASIPQATSPEEPMKRRSGSKAVLTALVVVVAVAAAALYVRRVEFQQAATNSTEQQSAATPSSATPSPAAPSPATPSATNAAPQAIEKPSPSGRGSQATPKTAAEAQSAPASHYAEPRDAESRGVLLRVNPEVLPQAQQSIRGEVNLSVRVTVDSRGNVSSADLVTPSRSKYFNRIAVDAARQWKFAAGAGGAWQIDFQFRQDGTDLRATRE